MRCGAIYDTFRSISGHADYSLQRNLKEIKNPLVGHQPDKGVFVFPKEKFYSLVKAVKTWKDNN